MNKKSFWIGFIAGGISLVIVAAILIFTLFSSPDLTLKEVDIENLNGKKVELTQYNEKPLVVNYWATWCAPCIKEFPHFEELKKEYGDKVNFVMISDEKNDRIKKFSESNSYNFNYLRSNKLLAEYGIQSLPVTYFYNSKG